MVMLLNGILHPLLAAPRMEGPDKVLHRAVERILKQKTPRGALVAVEISDPRTGIILCSINADLFLKPASNTKLFTTAASLLLGDSADFLTSMVLVPNEGGLDLHIAGSGDPLLRLQDIQNLVDSIRTDLYAWARRQGLPDSVSTLRRLVLHRHCSPSEPYGHGWMIEDLVDATIPSRSLFPVERGRLEVMVSAVSDRFGVPALVQVFPPLPGIEWTSSVRTGTVERIRIQRAPMANRFDISGTLPPGRSVRERFPIWNPDTAVLQLVVDTLRARGVATSVLPVVLSDEPLPQGILRSVRHSWRDVLNLANRFSDNLAAEVLLQRLGCRTGRIEDIEDSGLAMMKRCCASVGVDTALVRLVDGSGISHYNLTTVAAVGQLLRALPHRPGFSTFLASLAQPGLEGTLQSRLPSMSFRESLHAKTGTLRGVSTLSGFLGTEKEKMLVFSIFVQNFSGESGAAKAVQDAILEACHRWELQR